MAIMTASEARAALPEVLNRVEAGEEVTITRHGRAVAVVVRPDILWRNPPTRDLEARAERLERMIEAAGQREPAAGAITPEYAAELIADIRAGRESR